MPEPFLTPEQTSPPSFDELRTALEASVKLQSFYASLLNMHDGGERIGFADSAAWIARLRETGTLPVVQTPEQLKDALFTQFEPEQAERARRVSAEINEIMRGNFRSVEFELDPLSAYQLAGALDLALHHPQFPQSTRAALDTLYAGLVERIEPQCPELARQLADGRRQRIATGGAHRG